MKNIQIKAGQYLKGEVIIPPSKSLSHRAIIAAGLANGSSLVENLVMSKDIQVTTACMENLGAGFKKEHNGFRVEGLNNTVCLTKNVFKCHESGSTLRFMIPIAMLSNQPIEFHGEGQLRFRPLSPYFDIFEKQKIPYTYDGSLPLQVDRCLSPGKYEMRGDISSQFITGLLYTLPLLDGNSEIEITTPLESKGYVDLTLDVLNDFGILVDHEAYKKFQIKGKQVYKAHDYRVEGDYSQLAFWVVAALINGELNCKDMNLNSSQGDKELLDIVKRMGAKLELNPDSIKVKKTETNSTVIDASQCPDIIPVLTVLAALTPGKTEVINGSRLRIKECDRLKAISTELNKLGADVVELEDGLIINGKTSLIGGIVDGWNDHRIVMALTIASLRCQGDVFVTGCDAINKSYPHFFETFESLGGQFNEWYMEK